MASDRLIQRTIEFWQRHSSDPITHEKAIIVIENLSRLLDLLERWEREEREAFRRSFLYWGHFEDDGFEEEDARLTFITMSCNVYSNDKRIRCTQEILDYQAGGQFLRSHYGDSSDMG